jgi:excisionase family DNA binding protein
VDVDALANPVIIWYLSIATPCNLSQFRKRGLHMDNRLLLTPEHAADKLDVGRTTVYALMASGELRSVKIGRSRRVPVAALEDYVSRLVGKGSSAA